MWKKIVKFFGQGSLVAHTDAHAILFLNVSCAKGTTKPTQLRLRNSKRRRDEDDHVAPDKKHLNGTFTALNELLLRFFINVHCRHRLLDVLEHHIQVRVERMQHALQLTPSATFDVDTLTDAQLDQVQGLGDRGHCGVSRAFSRDALGTI